MKRHYILLAAGVAVSALSLTLFLLPDGIPISGVEFSKISQLFAVLFTLSIFVERAADVFLTIWRSAKSEDLKLRIETLRFEIAEFDKNTNGSIENPNIRKELVAERKKLETKRLEFRSHTRVIASWCIFVAGIVISLVSVRALRSLIDLQALPQIGTAHRGIFDIVDVLLTGGLLAGGSDGIHKLAELYRAFVEKSSTRVADSGTV